MAEFENRSRGESAAALEHTLRTSPDAVERLSAASELARLRPDGWRVSLSEAVVRETNPAVEESLRALLYLETGRGGEYLYREAISERPDGKPISREEARLEADHQFVTDNAEYSRRRAEAEEGEEGSSSPPPSGNRSTKAGTKASKTGVASLEDLETEFRSHLETIDNRREWSVTITDNNPGELDVRQKTLRLSISWYNERGEGVKVWGDVPASEFDPRTYAPDVAWSAPRHEAEMFGHEPLPGASPENVRRPNLGPDLERER